MPIFSKKEIKKTDLQLTMQTTAHVEQKKKIIRQWQQNIISRKIYQLSETQLDMSFIHQIFGEVLGYAYQEVELWNIDIKPTTETDTTRPDAVLGYFGTKEEERSPKAVIELKKANTNLDKNQNRKDFKGSPVEQAFAYTHKMKGHCKWVIVSNFLEIRLYHASDSSRYEKFEILTLLEEENFARFLFLLQKDNLFLQKIESRIELLYTQKRIDEENITTTFYTTYQTIREVLFNNIWKNNPEENPYEILRITQKIIDRIVFIAFVRDAIPMVDVLSEIQKMNELSHSRKIDKFWRMLKDAFESFDAGYAPKIPAFNGGLFRYDELLDDKIKIKDFYIMPLVDFVLKYDFQSELNVNILGHIFEQSIADIEAMKKDIDAQNPSELQEILLDNIENIPQHHGKRKKDGIFYTPDFVTNYLVKQTIGSYLDEKKEALLIQHQTETLAYWEDYQNVLTSLKVLDPACGSGAFLVAVFNYLWAEWQIVLREMDTLQNDTPKNTYQESGMFAGFREVTKADWQIKKSIIENNIYGVDLNAESVEISKLAMWLLTVNRFMTLADLSQNIKQGNSLIADRSIDECAFDWGKEFDFKFDVIVGNPPYVSANNMRFEHRQYINQPENYAYLKGKWDLFLPFFERGLSLLQPKGILSFIVPYGFLNQPFATIMRKWILDTFSLRSIVDLHEVKVFADATVPTCIPIIFKEKNRFQSIDILKLKIENDKHIFYVNHQIESEKYLHTENFMFRTEKLDLSFDLLSKIKNVGTQVEEFFYVSTGAEIHGKEQRTEHGELISGYSRKEIIEFKSRVGLKPFIEGSAIPKSRKIGRYYCPEISYYVDYDANFERMRSPKFKELFENPKIIIRKVAGLMGILATYDETKLYTSEGVIIVTDFKFVKEQKKLTTSTPYSPKVLLGILNSQLMYFYYKSVYGGFVNVFPNYIKSLPIPTTISPEIEASIVEKVDMLLTVHKNLSISRQNFIKVLKSQFGLVKPNERLEHWYELEWQTFTQEMKKSKAPISTKKEFEWIGIFEEKRNEVMTYISEIEAADKHIDKLIYALYDLSTAEIEMIENERDIL